MKIQGVDEFFEGDMKLTDDQLEALKRGSLEPRGDLGKVAYYFCSSSENTIQISTVDSVKRQNI